MQVIAVQSFRLDGRQVQAGEAVEVTPVWALALTYQKKARYPRKDEAAEPRKKRQYRRRDMTAEP